MITSSLDAVLRSSKTDTIVCSIREDMSVNTLSFNQRGQIIYPAVVGNVEYEI